MIFTFVFTLSLEGISQVKVEKSTVVEVVGNATYYVHTVLQGQTVYSITKAYNITEAELLAANPSLKDGLKKDQKLYIPKKNGNSDEKPLAKADEPKSFVNHEVKQGETLYKISREYKVDIEMLKKYNQGLTENISVGQIIKIPRFSVENPKSVVVPKKEEPKDSVFEYVVKKKDTYYKLEKKFRVNADRLIELNPNLRESGLKKDLVIKIPYIEGAEMYDAEKEKNDRKKEDKEEKAQQPAPPVIENPSDKPKQTEIKPEQKPAENVEVKPASKPQEAKTQDVKPAENKPVELKNNDKTYKIGIMVPFNTQMSGEINLDNKQSLQEPSKFQSFKFIGYYEGLLLALDSMQKLGLNAEVFVYDTKSDSNTVRQICNKPEFKDLDMIFGPFYTKNLSVVLPKAKAKGIVVINPLAKSGEFDAYENMVRVFPDEISHYSAMASYISDSLRSANVYIIHNQKSTELSELSKLRSELRKLALAGKLDSNRVRVFDYKSGGMKSMLDAINSKDRKYVIINLVKEEATISSFVRQMNIVAKEHNIVVLGREDQWEKFKTLETEYLVNIKLTLTTESFINYEQYATKRFMKLYHDEFKGDPSPIAYRGFDQGMYFLSMLLKCGDLKSCMTSFPSNSIDSEFKLKKSSKGAYVNTYISVYQYNNYHKVDMKRELILPPTEIKGVEQMENQNTESPK